MRVGYSCWGFLGGGVTDTPDGGRSHRRVLIDGIRSRGHEVILLQANRDYIEAGDDFRTTYSWEAGLPDIDLIFFEWRWRIPGRNDTPCDSVGHSCDLHRQQELLRHYTVDSRLKTVIWDKDRRLHRAASIRRLAHVTICEAGLYPRYGAASLLFPVSDEVLDTSDAESLAQLERTYDVVYIGNQYGRDGEFDRYFAGLARDAEHAVWGKWERVSRWPWVNFRGRLPFAEVEAKYRRSLATVLLLPGRYAAVGQMTQRVFEAALSGCLPMIPTSVRGAEQFAPPALHISDGATGMATLKSLRSIVGTPKHAKLIAACLRRLDIFRLSRQLSVLDRLFEEPIRRRNLG